jgi:uncharacterized damage-inducible protein DinB
MTLDDLRTLLDYHYWARDRLLEALETVPSDQFMRDLGSSFKSIRDTAAHLYGAEWAWYQRWHGEFPTELPAAANFPNVATIRRAWTEHEKKMRAFLEGLGEAGITRVFEYKSTDGRPGAMQFWQMLQHIVNHGSYHRGQVTTMLRQLGLQPAKPMDLIAFYRVVKPPA